MKIYCSFVPQRFDRVQLGGLAGRVEAEEDAYASGEGEGQQQRVDGDEGWPFKELGDKFGRAYTDADADESANQAQDQGLDEELVKDVSPARAHGHADTDLTGTFGHGDQHDIHD